MAGPAFSAAAIPVSENSPAPMMAPIPSATRLSGPSVRFSVWAPPSDSAMMRLRGLMASRLMRFSSLLDIPQSGGAPSVPYRKYTGTPRSTMISPGHVYTGL